MRIEDVVEKKKIICSYFLYKNKSIKKELSGNTSLNTDEIVFKCKEFYDIEKYVITLYKKINIYIYYHNLYYQ